MAMPCDPVTLTDLPDVVREEIAAHTGPLREVEVIAAGRNSPLSARIATARGEWFVKGLPAEGRWVDTQDREYAISRHLAGAGPVARWRVHAGGWHVVGFDHVAGRHADYRPGSPDLPLVADLLTRLGATPTPAGVPLRRAEQRLAEYTDHPDTFAGDTLVHSDLHPANVLTSHTTAYLVDWGWATQGAAWLDAAYWVIWLIAAGHTPAAAEQVAGRVPAFRSADADALDVFAAANTSMWTDITRHTSDPWRHAAAVAAAAWNAHRTSLR